MSLKILDIGCNFPAWALHKYQLAEEFTYTGIEIAPPEITQQPVFGIDYLKAKYPRAVKEFTNKDGTWKKLPDNFTIHFNTDALTWLKTHEEEYDILYLSNILHELPDKWEKLYDLAMEHLKKDGLVYVSVFYNASIDKEFYFTIDDLVKLKNPITIQEEVQNGLLHQFWGNKL